MLAQKKEREHHVRTPPKNRCGQQPTKKNQRMTQWNASFYSVEKRTKSSQANGIAGPAQNFCEEGALGYTVGGDAQGAAEERKHHVRLERLHDRPQPRVAAQNVSWVLLVTM